MVSSQPAHGRLPAGGDGGGPVLETPCIAVNASSIRTRSDDVGRYLAMPLGPREHRRMRSSLLRRGLNPARMQWAAPTPPQLVALAVLAPAVGRRQQLSRRRVDRAAHRVPPASQALYRNLSGELEGGLLGARPCGDLIEATCLSHRLPTGPRYTATVGQRRLNPHEIQITQCAIVV